MGASSELAERRVPQCGAADAPGAHPHQPTCSLPSTPLPANPAALFCSVDDGTLTRTMKPRRPAIMHKYAAQVARLEAQLR